jgi:predicted DNA-binding mobile mystery protein A
VKQVVDVSRVRDRNLVDLGVPDHERVAEVRERDGFFLQPRAQRRLGRRFVQEPSRAFAFVAPGFDWAVSVGRKVVLGVRRYAPPVRGWIKAIREALGMTTAQLAKRMGVRQPSVVALEQSEVRGTIELATLRRVAEALDCTLVYALIPNKPLEATIRERARAFARRRWRPVEHSMLLEDQQVKRKDSEAELEDIIRETNPRRFWE